MEENEIKLDVHYNGAHDVIVDLVNSLSTVKSLSDLGSQVTDEVTLIAHALDILMQNQDMERCSFFLFPESETSFSAHPDAVKLWAVRRKLAAEML